MKNYIDTILMSDVVNMKLEPPDSYFFMHCVVAVDVVSVCSEWVILICVGRSNFKTSSRRLSLVMSSKLPALIQQIWDADGE